jgi:hypothetical protein
MMVSLYRILWIFFFLCCSGVFLSEGATTTKVKPIYLYQHDFSSHNIREYTGSDDDAAQFQKSKGPRIVEFYSPSCVRTN